MKFKDILGAIGVRALFSLLSNKKQKVKDVVIDAATETAVEIIETEVSKQSNKASK